MIFYLDQQHFIDTAQPLDLSMTLRNDSLNARAWYVDTPTIEPVRANGFVGSVAEGGSVNFRDIFFNPHGHTTHTESFGHISPEIFPVGEVFQSYFYKATLITVQPIILPNGDKVVYANQLEHLLSSNFTEAIIVRTLPNKPEKTQTNYSGTNPCYFDVGVVDLLDQLETLHFLVDTPSVDREEDGGALAFHHAFWDFPNNPRKDRSITELIFADSSILDGTYILELQMANFKNDASPSRPLLYAINEKKD
ncbi:MAG: hypothetical protein RLZZ65_524 [Bacteroidota bacterium]|jgi:kynurenine formamidase